MRRWTTRMIIYRRVGVIVEHVLAVLALQWLTQM